MTLLHGIEQLKPNTIGMGEGYQDALDDAETIILAFAEKLEGEEMQKAVTDAIYEMRRKSNFSDDYAKAALAVVREMVG